MSGSSNLYKQLLAINFLHRKNYGTQTHVMACGNETASTLKRSSLNSTFYTHSFSSR